jgi:CBS domain-containing protein
MKTADILRTKGSTVVSVPPDLPVQEAIRVLAEHNIGALVVSDGRLRGIISERDLMRSAAADVQVLASATVQELMTTDVVTTTPEADVNQVMNIMTERRIRHLPVLLDGSVCGIISIGDVVNALRQVVETENRQLQSYIAGMPM